MAFGHLGEPVTRSTEDSWRRRMTFRYYDPRILSTYLPGCNSDELQTVFGPIECFWTEDQEDPRQMLEFRFEMNRLVKRRIPLKGA
jgi:hypothetical protein